LISHPPLCEHLQPGTWPFEIELVIDEQFGFTDVLVACRTCGRGYLLEMLDWRDRLRVMRVAPVEDTQAQGLLRTLDRGSCDIRRAGAELQHLRASTRHSDWLLLIDARELRVTGIASAPATPRLPGASWRELPCDGRWLDLPAWEHAPPS